VTNILRQCGCISAGCFTGVNVLVPESQAGIVTLLHLSIPYLKTMPFCQFFQGWKRAEQTAVLSNASLQKHVMQQNPSLLYLCCCCCWLTSALKAHLQFFI